MQDEAVSTLACVPEKHKQAQARAGQDWATGTMPTRRALCMARTSKVQPTLTSCVMRWATPSDEASLAVQVLEQRHGLVWVSAAVLAVEGWLMAALAMLTSLRVVLVMADVVFGVVALAVTSVMVHWPMQPLVVAVQASAKARLRALIAMSEVEGGSVSAMAAEAAWSMTPPLTVAAEAPETAVPHSMPMATPSTPTAETVAEGVPQTWMLVGQISSRMATSMLTQLRRKRFC